MTLASTHRRLKAAPRSALAALALAWVAVLAQPCAMAMAMDAVPVCPDCPPPAAAEAAPGMHGAAGHHGHSSHGDAYTGGAQMPCGTNQANCDALDDASVDGRTLKAKVQTGADAPPLAQVAPLALMRAPAASRRAMFCPLPPGAAPPIHLLNCVYLN